ncbi:sensor histidine kinase [Ramlibacter sp. USB13]|uniref:C4-dicarboxylate transport sensor protein DctB n=1 Tax=Ramlibacter cellulosilyticus TaxID=2764187 RepID=A0A923SCC4_9BURK|nr:ATP-binding protein [Ramlibacter cellulosilyticus]MBC5784826.1 sensor histidine kinase [Ramlibacter cellulosilyticus]
MVLTARLRRWAAGLFALATVLAGVAAAYHLGERAALRSVRAASAHRLDLYAASLRSELSRYEYLPPVLALNQDVIRLLRTPRSTTLREQVNRYLETVGEHAGASAVYVMDTAGLTLAASNWNQPASFVDMNFSYRPYFQDAVRGLAGRFYGIGTVSREPGYYFSWAIRDGDAVVGVAAVKVNLDKLDETWSHAAEKIIVSDGNGVVFLSSEPAWKFRTLGDLSEETKGKLQATRQYAEAGVLQPVGLTETRMLPDGGRAVRLGGPEAGGLLAPEYLFHTRSVAGTDWTLVVLSDLRPARSVAQTSATVTAFALAFLLLLALYVQQRRRSMLDSLASREALQRAHDELEQKVQQRTEALQSEIAERRRAEELLQATLEDLVQTGKMAVLGQMSAGITHELNQPLAALRTLSANTIVFLERGQQDEAVSNLRTICHVTDHMGKITAQLKKFARKSGARLDAVPVDAVVDDALSLLQQRMRNERVQLERVVPDGLRAWCEGNRLEQVLVNLLANALDALKAGGERRVRIVASACGEAVMLEVHDSGPGLPPEVMPRLFEPFFTTKDQGEGLGLGLAISAGIVRDFGGTLRAGRSPLGGALFSIQLKAATTLPATEPLTQDV